MMPFMTQPAVAPACYVPGYSIAQSQIFDGDAYLHRVQVAGNRTTWCGHTVFFRNVLGVQQCVFAAHTGNGTIASLDFLADDRLLFGVDIGGSTAHLITKRKFRDLGPLPITWGIETGLGTETDRLRLYVGLERVTDFDVVAYPAQNSPWAINQADVTLFLGQNTYYNNRFARLTMAPIILLDGIAPDPVLFGEYNIHGVWVPKRPAFTLDQYGPNGFHLDFSDPRNPGKDVSGKGNHFTALGFDATGRDTVTSSPTNVYATLNPLTNSTPVLSEGDLHYDVGTGYWGVVSSLMVPVGAGRYRMQMEHIGALTGSSCEVGVVQLQPKLATNGWLGGVTEAVNGVSWVYGGSGYVRTATNGVAVNTAAAGGVKNDTIVDVYLDTEANTVTFMRDDTLVGTFPLPNPTNGPWLFCVSLHNAEGAQRVNFGQRPWTYSGDPSYRALCTDNLPEPDIKDPAEAFVQVATTGTNMEGALAALTGHWNGAPYVEIIKRRNASEDWRVRFSDDPGNAWATNNAFAKAAAPALVSEGAYVGYRLRVGARYGVYTAEKDHTTGTATTVTHGLNTARNVVLATRVSAGGGSRYLRHPDMDAGKLMVMGGTTPGCVSDASLSDFSADSFRIAASAPSGTYRVLVLAERSGLLALTTHTGNGNADGVFVPTDVVPHLAMIVETTTSGGVKIWDAARSPSNPVTLSSVLTSSALESGSDAVDFVVGGVKPRSTGSTLNGSGVKYVGVVWGRPVGGVCVAPATAR